ncbi:phosphoglycerate mutase [Planococcus massiliensis]|nr:phosphoglycerate mutase [Planococcus massiliensis]
MNYFDAGYHVDFWRKLQMPDIYCLSFEGTELVAVKQIPLKVEIE